jgi:hypothetical protein
MTKREFEDWSRGDTIQNDKNYKNVRIKGKDIFVGRSPLVSFAEDISPRDRRYYENLLMEGALALSQNEYAKVFHFYNENEARTFDRFYQRELKALRSEK